MKMTIEKLPAYEMAYIRRTGPYGLGNIETMEKLKTWAIQNHLLDEDSIILGIAEDNPLTTRPEDCRYDCGLILHDPDPSFFTEEVHKGLTLEGQYAVFEVAHTAEAIQQAWSDLFTVLAKEGLHLDMSKPILERYAEKLLQQHLCEICVPIL